ncbi:hypothetical protein BDW67DRAFT_161349 [Aspergillus spinulosporus]
MVGGKSLFRPNDTGKSARYSAGIASTPPCNTCRASPGTLHLIQSPSIMRKVQTESESTLDLLNKHQASYPIAGLEPH